MDISTLKKPKQQRFHRLEVRKLSQRQLNSNSPYWKNKYLGKLWRVALMQPCLCSTVAPCLLIFLINSQSLLLFSYLFTAIPAAPTRHYWKERAARSLTSKHHMYQEKHASSNCSINRLCGRRIIHIRNLKQLP